MSCSLLSDSYYKNLDVMSTLSQQATTYSAPSSIAQITKQNYWPLISLKPL